MALRKNFRHFLHTNVFMFILLISNHTVFLVQFVINLHLPVQINSILISGAPAARRAAKRSPIPIGTGSHARIEIETHATLFSW